MRLRGGLESVGDALLGLEPEALGKRGAAGEHLVGKRSLGKRQRLYRCSPGAHNSNTVRRGGAAGRLSRDP
jgi:hypothetical protein